jgi:hypothetical protein
VLPILLERAVCILLTILSNSIALAFEVLSPKEVCRLFARALDRPCHYVHDSKIDVRVPIPTGYRAQLEGVELLFGQFKAPYYPGPEFPRPTKGSKDPLSQRLTQEARQLWEGWRGMEEYAREVFPVEEEANGLDWMNDLAYVT